MHEPDDRREPRTPCHHAERAADQMRARLSLASLAALDDDCRAVITTMLDTDDSNHVACDLRHRWPLGRSRAAMLRMRQIVEAGR